jgi:hypothetical protein
MRAPIAFLNGAGSRRTHKFGATDRSTLKLAELLYYTGFTLRPVPARSDASRGRSNRDNRR